MELKDLRDFLILNIFAILDFTMGATRPQNVRQLPQPMQGFNPNYSTRIFPFGQLSPLTNPNPQIYSQGPYSPQTKVKDFPMAQYFPPSGIFDDPRPMSLDDAFKMGYQAGKSIAVGENLRNRPMCGVGSSNQQGTSCGTSTINFFFPSKPNYSQDPGFILPDSGFQLTDSNQFDNSYDPENVFPDDDLDLDPSMFFDEDYAPLYEFTFEPDVPASSQSTDSNVTTPDKVDDSSNESVAAEVVDSKVGDDDSKVGDDDSKGATDVPKAAADDSKAAADVPKAAADDSKAAADVPKAAADDSKGAADAPKAAADDSKGAADATKAAASDDSKGTADASKATVDSPNPEADAPKVTEPSPVGNGTADVAPVSDNNVTVPAVSNK